MLDTRAMSDHSRKSMQKNKSKRNLLQQEDMVDRLAKIEFANPVCADCPNAQPRWASFLKDKHVEDSEGDENGSQAALRVEGCLSVMVCDDCAIKHHNELGAKRCKLKCLECFHEWTHQEADIVLTSGNTLVNAIYESNLHSMGDFDKDVVVTDDAEVEDNRRSKFIKNKYKKAKYRNDAALQKTLEEHHNLHQRQQSLSPKSKAKKWSKDSTHSKKSRSFLKLLRTSGHRGVSRATKAFNNSHNTDSGKDSAPKRPDRALSSATSSNYQASSGVSSITWSEGRSGYSVASDIVSDEDSISSWWDADQ